MRDGKTNHLNLVSSTIFLFMVGLLTSTTGYSSDCEKSSNSGEAVICLEKLIKTISSNQKQLSGAVIAFNLKKCPDGWSEYTPAYGRFVRGIDRGNPKIDPDGTRTHGNIQDDQLQVHRHRVAEGTVQSFNFLPQTSDYYAPIIGTGAVANNYPETTPPLHVRTGNETRPKNVSLLYCEKD